MIRAAEPSARPRLWGIVRVVYEVPDHAEARRFFGEHLGYVPVFDYATARGRSLVFKVNDAQFIECVAVPGASRERPLVVCSFETEDPEAMRRHLAARGVEVPTSLVDDGAGNRVLRLKGPEGLGVEFVQIPEGSLHRKSRVLAAAPTRIGARIHHLGLAVTDVAAAARFFVEAVGCEEFWRAEPEGTPKNFIYYKLPDCAEYVEFMIGTAQPGKPNAHPCLLVSDMQEAVQTLRQRTGGGRLRKPTIGKGRRWLLQMESLEGIPVELTELHTAR